MDDLAAIVAELLDCRVDDPRVPACVASIHAQWLLFGPSQIASRFRAKLHLRADAALADHIATFSLAGIHALAGVGAR